MEEKEEKDEEVEGVRGRRGGRGAAGGNTVARWNMDTCTYLPAPERRAWSMSARFLIAPPTSCNAPPTTDHMIMNTT